MCSSEARAEALLALADGYLAGKSRTRTGGDRYQVLVHVDAATLTGDDETGRGGLQDGAPLASETARRLACDASLVALLERDGKRLRIGRTTRTIPPALRRALSSRDRGCRFPGCIARRFVDAHHIEPAAARPISTTSSNYAALITGSYTRVATACAARPPGG